MATTQPDCTETPRAIRTFWLPAKNTTDHIVRRQSHHSSLTVPRHPVKLIRTCLVAGITDHDRSAANLGVQGAALFRCLPLSQRKAGLGWLMPGHGTAGSRVDHFTVQTVRHWSIGVKSPVMRERTCLTLSPPSSASFECVAPNIL